MTSHKIGKIKNNNIVVGLIAHLLFKAGIARIYKTLNLSSSP